MGDLAFLYSLLQPKSGLLFFDLFHALGVLRRPHNRCPDVRGLYFAGCTTHPGGGVPMVALSGKVAAQMALNWSNERT